MGIDPGQLVPLEQEEEWRDVPGMPFQASSWGRVRRPGGRLLKPIDQGHYDYVSHYTFEPERKRHNAYIHHLVAAAFLGPRPLRSEINHKSGEKRDNRPVNLEYLTRSDNLWHGGFGRRPGKSSVFFGVSLRPSGKWVARHNNATLGIFTVEAHAAMTYDAHLLAQGRRYTPTNFDYPEDRHG